MRDLIWRLENRSGDGAYLGTRQAHNSTRQNYSSGDDVHPSPVWADIIPFKRREHIFGFSSLASARRWWFDVDDLREWHEGGLRLAVWPRAASDEVLEGKRQCAFRRPAVGPLYLPAFAIHEMTEETIAALVADHFD